MSTQEICLSLRIRSDSGTSRGIAPFKSMSASSDRGIDNFDFFPSAVKSPRSMVRSSKDAPDETSAKSALLSFLFNLSVVVERIALLTRRLKFAFLNSGSFSGSISNLSGSKSNSRAISC